MDLARLLDSLPPAETLTRLRDQLAAGRRRAEATRRFELSFPDEGPLRRELYHKAVGFFAAGATHLERGLLGGNRSGKSTTAAYELTCHLTGRYPHWWEGKRFERPVTAWAAGEDAKSVREAAQTVLLGEPGSPGTGMIPREAIVSGTRRMGVADAYDTVLVRHQSGGRSRLVFKAYDQRRESFQGARVDVGWCDEEPPWDVYSEFLTRLLSTVPGEPNGVMLATFTPLKGLSQVVLQFLPGGKPSADNTRYVTFVSWDDAPHLSPELRAELEAAYMPHEREARTKGIPSIGSGAIYPVPESDIVIKPFELPPWYVRAYGFDVGWNRTAGIWGALNYENDVLYLYDEYYQSHAEPSVHAQAIRMRGDWVPGAIDPASRGRAQHDGEQLLALYRDLGVAHLEVADNAVEAGIYEVWQRMVSGRLKVFDTLASWLTEFRIYRRDDKGRIVKPASPDQPGDHLMDATRYLVMSGLRRAVAKPINRLREGEWPAGVRGGSQYTYDYDPLPYGRR